MAESITLARPYARAAFEFARDRKQLASWSEGLRLLATLVSHPKLEALIRSVKFSSDQKAAILMDVSDGGLDAELAKFLNVLALNDRLALLSDISHLFDNYRDKQEQSLEVDVESAFTLSATQRKALESSLKKALQRDVKLDVSVKKNLLGGVCIRTGDTVIDASVRGRLAQLSSAVNV